MVLFLAFDELRGKITTFFGKILSEINGLLELKFASTFYKSHGFKQEKRKVIVFHFPFLIIQKIY